MDIKLAKGITRRPSTRKHFLLFVLCNKYCYSFASLSSKLKGLLTFFILLFFSFLFFLFTLRV